jgi:hypothetical protein
MPRWRAFQSSVSFSGLRPLSRMIWCSECSMLSAT